jgi:diaminohydroxyphosphoribosylaminopyrimidine deaminase/5-amino-6-(5-phosphoribosylamino)uracil reductase
MREAFALAERGWPAPNPRVGCVIVQDDQIVGRGWHEAAGLPHAEAAALADAGAAAQGADVYVTLEPCSHHGRTPPCSDALISAGVNRVFVANLDPNPSAAGGADRLREAGVEVESGVLKSDGWRVNSVFLHAHTEGRPFVCLKAAITTDGFLARSDGSSRWISGKESRTEAHRLRLEMGTVLVGRGTVEADDPQLTARHIESVNQPLKVVLDSSGRLTGKEKVFEGARPLWLTTSADRSGQTAIAQDENGLDLQAVLAELRRLGQIGVLVEGGAQIHKSFLESGLVDRVDLFIAPKTFGEGIIWSGGAGPIDLEQLEFKLAKKRPSGADSWETWLRSEH